MIIKTSSENRQVVAKLSRKYGLGSENHIARIALTYSLENDGKLNLADIENSSGKEYSKSVFFGNYYELYVGLVCIKYELHSSDVDIPKYIKMHIDAGLKFLDESYKCNGPSEIFNLIPPSE